MRKVVGLLGFILMVSTLSFTALAIPTKDGVSGKGNEGKKSTDVSFDDVLVQGRYNFSDEAVTTVEEDKVLDALLAVRKDFQDRNKKSKEQK